MSLPQQIFTDGSSRPHMGKNAGFAYCTTIKDKDTVIYGTIIKGTNNQAELLAVISALRRFRKMSNFPIDFYSDSQYVVKGINEWMEGWKNRGWKKGDRSPISNPELWKEVYILWNEREFTRIKWVKGHSGNKMNDLADKFANYGSDGILQESITIDSNTNIVYEGVFNDEGKREKI